MIGAYQYEDLSATVDQNGWSAWRVPPLIEGIQHYRTACCDCGLVHKIALYVDDTGLVAIAFKRHARATAQIRRHLHRWETHPVPTQTKTISPLDGFSAPDQEMPPVVRPQRAWQLLQINPSTGWKWVRAGRIKTTRMGRVTWISVSELQDLVAGRKNAAE